MSFLRRVEAVGADFSCSSNDFTRDTGPFHIDYAHLFLCDFKDFEFVFVVLVVIWIVVLIDLLAKTASDYFTPTLATISLKWKLSNNFAGVTLVALANGAPDIFSSIIGLTSTGSADVSIGALFGGGLFVCTVVVGCIALLSPCKLSGLYFTRDSIFLLAAVVTLSVLGIHRTVTLLSASSLCLIYVLYLVVVLITPWVEAQVTQCLYERDIIPPVNSIPLIRITNLQTAFWLQSNDSSYEDEGTNERTSLTQISTDQSKVSSLDESDSIAVVESQVNAYKFIILNEDNDQDNIEEGNLHATSDLTKVNENNVSTDNEEATINISGSLLGQSFSGKVIADYFNFMTSTVTSTETSAIDNTTNLSSNLTDKTNLRENKKGIDGVNLFMHSTTSVTKSLLRNTEVEESLRVSLLSESVDASEDSGANEEISQNLNSYAKSTETSSFPLKCTNLIVLSMRRRFMTRLGRDWKEVSMTEKFLLIIEYPFVIARDLTIPTLDTELWCKKHAAVQPILCCIFLLYLSGGIENILENSSIAAYLGVLSILPTLYIYFLTHKSHPPSNGIFVHFWLFCGFIMCVSWIYLLAGELVNCLKSVGTVFGIPPYYLGLTVLAWGNSIGDLFSNIAVAKKGLGEMAIAGCYGGPVFNILIGMGVSLTYLCYRDYPHPYVLVLDRSAYVSIGFLCVVLISTIILAAFLNFRLNAWIGYYLITIYVLYTITQTIIAISNI